MGFQFDMSFCDVSNVKPKSESNTEEKELNIFLKVKTELPVAVLDQLIDDDFNFSEVFYDAKGVLITEEVDHIVFKNVYDNVRMGLSFSGVFNGMDSDVEFFPNCKINEVSAKLVNSERCLFSFKIKIKPVEKDIAMLNMCLTKPCYISVKSEAPDQETMEFE